MAAPQTLLFLKAFFLLSFMQQAFVAAAAVYRAGCLSSGEDRPAKIIRQPDMCCVSHMNAIAL